MIPGEPGMQSQQPMHQMPDGSMMPGATHGEQPMMGAQEEIDPQVMQITELFNTSIQEGNKPHDVVISLIEQQVDQNLIGQALMQLGMEQEAIVQLFQEVQQMQQPQEPSAEQINNNPQQISRAEAIQEEAPGMDMNITSIDQAKSGIEIKPENKGKFTRWAKARGMTVPEAAKKVMSNTKAYPPSVVKMANFAKNAATFKKQEGGATDYTEGVRQREGSYNPPNRKYTLDPRFKAQTGTETSTANTGTQGQENLNMMNAITAGKVNFTDTSKPKPKGPGFIEGLENEGILEPGPMYVNPAIYNQGKFNLGNAANALLGGYEDMFSGRDTDGDGVKDGSFRDWKGKTIKNKMNKVANATYDLELNLSDENKTAAKNWWEQFKIENPDETQQKDLLGNIIQTETEKQINKANAPSGLSDVSAKLIEQWKAGSAATKAYIESILKQQGKTIPAEEEVEEEVEVEVEKEEVLRNGGSLPRAQYSFPDGPGSYDGSYGGGKYTFPDGFDSSTMDFSNYFKQFQTTDYNRDTRNAADAVLQSANPTLGPTPLQQQTNQMMQNLASGPQNVSTKAKEEKGLVEEVKPETAEDLYKKIDQGSLDVNYGGVGGFIDRVKNGKVATAFGDVSDFLVKGAGVVNDYFDEVEQEEAMQDMRVGLSADNIYGTKTDAFNKRGTFDINTGIMGSEGDATTGLYMSKKGGGVNNPGFKALPPEAQHNILKFMQNAGEIVEVPAEEEQLTVAQDTLQPLPKEFRESELGKQLYNLSQPSQEEVMSVWDQAKNIDSIGTGLDFFSEVSKKDLQRLLQEAQIEKQDVRDYVYDQPFYQDASGVSKFGIRSAMKIKGLKKGGEAAYLANRDRVIKREMAKAQGGGEIVQVDSRMLAKLIAAGADIEKL